MKRTAIIMLLALISLGVWAQGGSESSETTRYSVRELPYEPRTIVQIELCEDLVAIFESNGVDVMYLNVEPNTLNSSMIDTLNSIVDDNYDEISTLVKSELKAGLKRDEVEYAYMILGTKMFNISFAGFAE